jgi:hypothetical protein
MVIQVQRTQIDLDKLCCVVLDGNSDSELAQFPLHW